MAAQDTSAEMLFSHLLPCLPKLHTLSRSPWWRKHDCSDASRIFYHLLVYPLMSCAEMRHFTRPQGVSAIQPTSIRSLMIYNLLLHESGGWALVGVNYRSVCIIKL